MRWGGRKAVVKTKLDTEGFGQAISMIVQIWAVFKEVMLQTKVGLEFVTWVLGDGKEKFKASLRALIEECRKTPPPEPKVEHIINFDLPSKCPPGLHVAPADQQLRSRIRGKRNFKRIKVEIFFHRNNDSRGSEIKEFLDAACTEVWGDQLLDFYLSNTDLIPKDFKIQGRILFWGTIYTDDHGVQFVRYLEFNWVGKRWSSDFQSLEDFWSMDNKVAYQPG